MVCSRLAGATAAWILFSSVAVAQGPTPVLPKAADPSVAPAGEPLARLAAAMLPIDVDGDGDAEVSALDVLDGAGLATAPRVLVLVESRLLSLREGVTAQRREALRQRLSRLVVDLGAGGYRADLVSTAVYRGPRHQDGRTLLGLRRFIRACAAATAVEGVLLVGHFPDALLVRTCNWRKRSAVKLPGPDGSKLEFGKATRWLRRVPEIVAHKCDFVLADLDGHWEARYLCAPTDLPRVEAVFADEASLSAGGAVAALRVSAVQMADVFHVADGAVAVDQQRFAVSIDDATRDLECTAADRVRKNAIAQPEIAVSRIDARGVAWSPQPRFLGAGGVPQRVEFGGLESPPRWDRVWRPDPDLELRLLCDYLDRNHAYRAGGVRPEARRPASIAWGLRSGMRSLRRADPQWARFKAPGYDVDQQVDLCALVAWMRRPALLRTLRAHSSGVFAQFARTDVTALERAIGGAPFCFGKRGNALVPSLREACAGGRAGFYLYRTCWENHALPADPYLLVHTGCEALSPPHAERLAYDHRSYGALQHAESLLFYTPCVAIVGRAKVFYDEPRGFCAALASGGSFGAAWRRYAAIDGAAPTWGEVGGDIGRKRSYFWSLLGDFTLRLR